jgi:hypothetical protein
MSATYSLRFRRWQQRWYDEKGRFGSLDEAKAAADDAPPWEYCFSGLWVADDKVGRWSVWKEAE